MAKITPEELQPSEATAISTADAASHNHGIKITAADLKSKVAGVFSGRMSASHKLLTDETTLKHSLYALRLAVFFDAMCQMLLAPNFPQMVLPGAHKDSWKSIPMEYAAALNFIGMASDVATAIASIAFGPLSDKIGRKPCLMLCLYVGACGNLLKLGFGSPAYGGTFWGFTIANFVNGLFGASTVVATAYACDIYPHDKKKKEEEMGAIMGMQIMGINLGGICAILFESSGLFMPLWVGAGISVVGGLAITFYFVEADKDLHQEVDAHEAEKTKKPAAKEDDDEAPKELDWKKFAMVCWGAVIDNLGSTGIMSLCLSVMMIQVYITDPLYECTVTYADPVTGAATSTQDFSDCTNFANGFDSEYGTYNGMLVSNIEEGESIITFTAYKWILVCVAFAVIPGAALSPVVFEKIGYAGGAVFGNLATAAQQIALVTIAQMATTKANFGLYVAVMYGGFGFTFISQISTGPMLDAIAPTEKKGFVQGVNQFVCTLSGSVGGYLLGEFADKNGIFTAIWVTVGLSLAAVVFNAPLLMFKQFRAQPPKKPKDSIALLGEDHDLVEKALKGEYIPAAAMDMINEERMKKGQPFLRIHYGKYADEKDKLDELGAHAKEDFAYFKSSTTQYLAMMQDAGARKDMLEMINVSRASSEQQKEIAAELGAWFTDYLIGSGYWVDDNPNSMKQMIMSAFPPLNDGTWTEDNMLPSMLKVVRIMNKHIELQSEATPLQKLLAVGQATRANHKQD